MQWSHKRQPNSATLSRNSAGHSEATTNHNLKCLARMPYMMPSISPRRQGLAYSKECGIREPLLAKVEDEIENNRFKQEVCFENN
jgi:hypothetical protein